MKTVEANLFAGMNTAVVDAGTAAPAAVPSNPAFLHAGRVQRRTSLLLLSVPPALDLLGLLPTIALDNLERGTSRAWTKVAELLLSADLLLIDTRLTSQAWSMLPQFRSFPHISSHTGVRAALLELATAHLTVRPVWWLGQGTTNAT